MIYAPTSLCPSVLAAPALTAEPASQAACFQVQFLARLPNLEAKQFVQQVAALGSAGTEASLPSLATLRQQADNLRTAEGQSYTRLASLLTRLGAPHSLRTWASSEAARLNHPVTLSKAEQKEAKSDPDSAAILATLDEAEALKADTDNEMSGIGTWISLTYHQPGLWAADVGEMTAALHVAVAHQVPPRLTTELARHLQQAAPAGTLPQVRYALGLLAPPAPGNLGGLVSTAVPIPLPTAAQVAETLITAFAAKPLE